METEIIMESNFALHVYVSSFLIFDIFYFTLLGCM